MHIFNPAKTVVPVLVFVLFLVVPNNTAQQLSREELDSVYSKFIQVRAPHLLEQPEELTAEERKCGFEIVNRIKINLEYFSAEQQAILKPLLQRPVMHTSIVSPSGFFRIHYDTTGSNIPSYISSASIEANVQEVAKAIDSAYNFEVNFLEYLPPPNDFGEGGDNLYDIYIFRTGYYGRTTPEDIINEEQQTYTSYIEIDPKFGSEFFTHGIDAMRVTVAHELHHAIQIGNYTLRYNEDAFFYEITSTAMEEFVFDYVNDYYAYMGSYFRNPETPLPLTTGYNTAVWNIYLRDNFDYDIIKRQWELMPSVRAMFAINTSILEYGSSFAREFNRYGLWMHFTNFRAIPGKYFEEGVNYPLVEPTSIIQFNQSHPPLVMTSKAAAHTFITFAVQSRSDSLVAIVSNGDAQNAVYGLNNSFEFHYTLFSDSSSGGRFLTENYSSTFSAGNNTIWSVSEILNDQIVREGSNQIIPPTSDGSFVFPNPFTYADLFTGFQPFINISFEASSGTNVDFHVYSSGMMQVFSSEEIIGPLRNNSVGITWDGLDNDGNKLASGVYIYVIKNGDDIVKGKVVIFNE